MTLFFGGMALLFGAGVCAAAARHWSGTAYQALLASGCVLAAGDAIRALVTGAHATLTLPATTPGGDWQFGIDPLSALFLLVVLGVGTACAIFGAHDLARDRHASRFANASFAALLGSIALVIASRSVFPFLIAWEVMAISSYVLIVTHDEDAGVRRAGLIYLVATHTATLALFAMFAIWISPTSAWTFDALAIVAPDLAPGQRAGILLLALAGFGFKAGSVPLHFWLPPAHAAAPSHVSALMSGVVIKTGIYGLLRVLVLLGGAPAWFGWTVLAIGLASALLGVLWALAQHDIKRLLAYHSVENIGIILMGVGVGVLGIASGAPAVALVGFTAGALHTVNHALFKALLFLGAGAVYRATGTRNLEELGGLARRMPLTWLGFVVGAAAIIGVPPFNGFVSEWLVFQSLFAAGQSGGALRLALVGIPLLALVGGLALACFAKVAGVAFLGSPRTERAAAATEVDGAGRWPGLALAAACVALGVVPLTGIAVVGPAARQLIGTADAAAVLPDAIVSGAAALSFLALITIALAVTFWWLGRRLVRGPRIRHDVTWACAYDAVTPRMQYTASSFAAPLLTVFGSLTGVRTHRSPNALHTDAADLVLDDAALPLWRVLHSAAAWLRIVAQGRGRVHVYLLFVMAALLVLLGYLSLGSRS